MLQINSAKTTRTHRKTWGGSGGPRAKPGMLTHWELEVGRPRPAAQIPRKSNGGKSRQKTGTRGGKGGGWKEKFLYQGVLLHPARVGKPAVEKLWAGETPLRSEAGKRKGVPGGGGERWGGYNRESIPCGSIS